MRHLRKLRPFCIAAVAAFAASACSDCGNGSSLVGDSDAGADAGLVDVAVPVDQDPSVYVDLATPDFGECSPEREDPPDPWFFDANCDGIDGDIARSVFVSSTGDDLNPGTQALPKATIGAAVETAASEGKTFVLLADGVFDGGFALADGVGVAGGYGFGWERSGRFKTTIRGGNPAIRGEGIASRTLLTGFTVEPGAEIAEGETAVTIYLASSPGVALRDITVQGGVGGDGADGTPGVDGGDGPDGGDGGDGREDGGVTCSSNDRPEAGAGGLGDCALGGGGRGGLPAKGGDAGEAGIDSAQGALGGTPGPASQPGGRGADGDRGENGSPGSGGDVDGSFQGMQWVGSNGGEGSDGEPGIGGGGGGGGGGGDSFCDSWGGAGGGGGAGGCGGTGGGGGRHGGASVALFLVDSDIEIVESTIIGGVGGRGGSGGEGGAGGRGGQGGEGGAREDDSGIGGRGGDGGVGGRGGQGGAGAGGPSFAIYSTKQLSVPPVNTDVRAGQGGLGGIAASAEGKGADGATETLRVAP